MGLIMHAQADSRLVHFNTLALHYQDEAFTLAYYLLGDEARAGEATQAAFARLYRRPGIRLDRFRLEILRRVLANSHAGSGGLSQTAANENLVRQLMGLKVDERSAIILVDVLGLSYDEAAEVLNSTKKQVGKLLAQARMRLSRQADLAN